MVARPGTYQASNNAGELAPEEYGRTDLKQFYSGSATSLNVEPVPQGGSQLTARTRDLGRVRNVMVGVLLSASALPAGSYNAAAVLATANFPATLVSAIVLTSWKASIALGAILQAEYLAGGSYVAFGSPVTMDTDTGTLTIALTPYQPVFTTDVRIRMVSDPPGAVTFTAARISLLQETGELPLARVRPFTYSLTQTYVAALATGFVDFYRDGVWVGSSVHGFGQDKITTLDYVQRLDTLMIFNSGGVSQRILRQSDTQWKLSNVPFTDVPNVDLGGDYHNQVADSWALNLTFPTADGDSHKDGAGLALQMTVNGLAAYYGFPGGEPDWTGTIGPGIKAAIESISGVSPGVTVSPAAPSGGAEQITITFTGAGNLGSTFAFSAQVVNTTSAAANVAHTAIGDPGGEALISDARGYASAGQFYQDRLVTGGFAAKPGAWLASETGEYFNCNIKLQGPSGPLLANLDTDGAETIQHIVNDNFLVFFTSDAEYFISDRTIDRTKPPNIVNSSRYGSAPDLPVLSIAGEVIWFSRNKTVMYAASFDEISQKYGATPISLLASHIANDAADMAAQRPSGTTDAARLWIPRSDGSVTIGVMLRNQDVTAFVRWQTAGFVRSACIDGKNVPHMVVQRTVAGSQQLRLERCEDGLLFDGVVEQTFDAPQEVITGLSAHERATVWADADGFIVGPFVVIGGRIDLGFAARNVKVGRWTPPVWKSLPLPNEVAERVVVERPKNVHTVRVAVKDTTSIAIGANDRRPRDVALGRAGDQADVPQPGISDKIEVNGIAGWTKTGQAVITQTRPGRLAWTGITLEAQ